MAEVIFITPNISKNLSNESIGTLTLATILKNNGIDVKIMPFYQFGDMSDFDLFISRAVEMIGAEKPKIVSFYTRCDTYHIMIKLAERIKAELSAYVVFGGPQGDISAKDTLKYVDCVDFICCGEGENTIYPFFKSLIDGSPDLSVDGLAYKKDREVIVNRRPPLIEDLDRVPMFNESVFPEDSFFDNSEDFQIDVGRGCPFGCTYCSTKSFWGRKYRLKSPQRIVEEIKYFHDKLGVNNFAFDHDMFTMNRNKVIETCELIKKLDFKIKFRCSARLDCIDNELIDIMTEAGLVRIYFGIETGSKRMQKLINKNLKLDDIGEKLKYVKSKGIYIVTSFIYGFPEETESDISQTIAMISDIFSLGGIYVQTHLCTFLPGTELSSRYREQFTEQTAYSDIVGSLGVEECKDIIRKYPDIFWHFNEYKTELRTKLRYFFLFILAWQHFMPAYRHFALRYQIGHLIDMYFDFVKDNEDILKSTEGMEYAEKANYIIKNDRFLNRFMDDEYAGVIMDIYRLERARSSVQSGEISSAIEAVSVSPTDIDSCGHLSECKRGICMVKFVKDEKDNSVKKHILARPMGNK